MDNTQREAVVTVIEGRVRSFEAAERARDPERLIAHFASVPEFISITMVAVRPMP